MTDFNFCIDLPIRSDWANVALMRTSVQNCFTAVFSDIDGCQSLAMVTGELLENAIKYGDWSGTEGGVFRLRVWGTGRQAHVSVENPIKKDDPGALDVFNTIKWLRGYPSPREAYKARLLEIAEAPEESNASRLGLVRIAYEANCTLSAEIFPRGDKMTLRITAEAQV